MSSARKNVAAIVRLICAHDGAQRRYYAAMLAHLESGAPVPVPADYGVGETFATNARSRLVNLGTSAGESPS